MTTKKKLQLLPFITINLYKSEYNAKNFLFTDPFISGLISHHLQIFYYFIQSRTFPPLPNHNQSQNQDINIDTVLLFDLQSLFKFLQLFH